MRGTIPFIVKILNIPFHFSIDCYARCLPSLPTGQETPLEILLPIPQRLDGIKYFKILKIQLLLQFTINIINNNNYETILERL